MRFLVIVLLLAPALAGQGVEYIKAHYTKYEYMVPMRDGVKLFTSVYVPKDPSQKYPIMLLRTPYSVAPYGVDLYRASLGPWEQFAREGFIFVYQDVRGSVNSEGKYLNVRPHNPGKKAGEVDESTDTYDTIDWLVKNLPNNNGRVGMWGISYPGFYVAAGMIDAHPALKAASPQAPLADWFVGDDFHHNGALYLAHAFRFFSNFKYKGPRPEMGTQDGYRFFLEAGTLANLRDKYFKDQPDSFWQDLMTHPNYDAFWQARNLRPHLKNIKPAVMTVGGWFDAEDLFGALETYASVEKQSPGAYNVLVMGPWFHGGWARADGDGLGDARFNSKTGVFYREKIELPFFNHFLKDKPDPKHPEACVFETGTNVWRTSDAWPPRNTVSRTLYFHAGGKLSFDPPVAGTATFAEYISDPARPVPFTSVIAPGMTREHMVDDQRFAASRTDVLVFQTEPLNEDVTFCGPLVPELFVSTSGTDSDWVVKLIDVYPDSFPNPDPNPKGVQMGGYQQLVRGELFRGKFRNSFEKPEPFVPGQTARVSYPMPGICHAFRTGHRIMVQVQSSWFPLVDRNPQRFMDIYQAKPEDFQKATQRVYHAPGQASGVKVLVIRP
jgi:hypothetical protein